MLLGQHVSGWWAIEMALVGGDDGWPPVFTDARAPCLQVVTLGARLGATAPIVVATYQNDTEFGLLVRAPTGPR